MRTWTELAQSASGGQARRLRGLLVVPDGARRSELDRLRKAETVTSGAGMVPAVRRVSDVASLGLGGADVSAVPHRRVVAPARYGMGGRRRRRCVVIPSRVGSRLVATVRSLEAKAVDDALELFDVLMTNDLLARAARESRNEKLRRYPRLAKDAGKLAAAVGVLLNALEHEQQLCLDLVWEEIEGKVSRAELRAAVAHLMEVAPPADADPDGEWRTALVERFASVRAFVALLCETIEFGATAQAAGILAAMSTLPGLLDARATVAVPTGYLDARRVGEEIVSAGWWRRLVYSADRPEGTVDRAAYVFCVLEQFHRLPPFPGRDANRRMRTRMSGGVGGAGVSPAPTRFTSVRGRPIQTSLRGGRFGPWPRSLDGASDVLREFCAARRSRRGDGVATRRWCCHSSRSSAPSRPRYLRNCPASGDRESAQT